MIHSYGTASAAESHDTQLEVLPRSRTVRLAATVAMPIQLQASIQFSDRGSPSGARAVLDGAVVLAGLSAVLTFSRGVDIRKMAERSVEREIVLFPAGDWFVMSGSLFHAPIAKGSPVQIQFRDSGSTLLTDARSLGQMGDAPLGFCASFCVPVHLLAEIVTDDRVCGPGSRATVGGRLVFPRGIVARCTFRLGGGRGECGPVSVGSVDTVAVHPGHSLHFANSLMLAPTPAGPLKEIALLDGHGYRFASGGIPSYSERGGQ